MTGFPSLFFFLFFFSLSVGPVLVTLIHQDFWNSVAQKSVQMVWAGDEVSAGKAIQRKTKITIPNELRLVFLLVVAAMRIDQMVRSNPRWRQGYRAEEVAWESGVEIDQWSTRSIDLHGWMKREYWYAFFRQQHNGGIVQHDTPLITGILYYYYLDGKLIRYI